MKNQKTYQIEIIHSKRERHEIRAASLADAERIGREIAAQENEFCDPCDGFAVALGRVVEINEEAGE